MSRIQRWAIAIGCLALSSSGACGEGPVEHIGASTPTQDAGMAPSQPGMMADAGKPPLPAAGTPAQMIDAAAGPTGRDAGPGMRAAIDAATPNLDDDAGEPPSSGLPPRCSGCAAERQDAMDMSIHLHHVHMNVLDRERTKKFYQEFFDAKAIELNAATQALQAEPVLLLVEQQKQAPPSGLPTSLQHIGWGSSDPIAWYEDAHRRGVAPDTRGFTLFNTNETPTAAGPGILLAAALGIESPSCFPIPDQIAYMYVLGPDNERIEVWSGADKRINHLHFTTPDLPATIQWYQKYLKLGLGVNTAASSASFFVDQILFFWEPIGQPADYADTDDHVLGHVAFSVTDLAAWHKRAQEQGITIVADPTPTAGFNSFFVRAPDGVLVELVQAAPLPELCIED